MALPDHIDVAGKTLTNILTEPVTWAPFIPVAAGFSFFGAPWWACFPASILIALGEFQWWKRRWGFMKAKARLELFREYFETENKQLQEKLQKCSIPAIAKEVRAALKIKNEIEVVVMEDSVITEEEIVVVKQVGSVCQAMCGDAATVSFGVNSRAEVEVKIEEFARARQTVEQAYQHFQTLSQDTESQSSLTAASNQLAETVRSATEVREYVTQSMEEKQRKIEQALENQNKETQT